jgi:predicted transcriptional regulator
MSKDFVQVRVPRRIWARIRDIAAVFDRSATAQVRVALEEHITEDRRKWDRIREAAVAGIAGEDFPE